MIRNLKRKLFIRNNIFLHAVLPETNPCSPSPCGPNSNCRDVNGLAVCTCLPNFIGSPPNCRAECVVNSQCSQDLACVNQKCISPCPDPCGISTQCRVISHSPICVCNLGYTGDPFTRCFPAPRKNMISLISFIHSCHRFTFTGLIHSFIHIRSSQSSASFIHSFTSEVHSHQLYSFMP